MPKLGLFIPSADVRYFAAPPWRDRKQLARRETILHPEIPYLSRSFSYGQLFSRTRRNRGQERSASGCVLAVEQQQQQ